MIDLTVRPLAHNLWDIEKQVGWLNDPENVKFSEQRHFTHTVASQDIYVDSFFAPNLLMGVYRRDELVGTVSAFVDEPNGVADVGILIGKTYWGKGIGTAAWEMFCDAIFADGIRKIEAGMMAVNHGMIEICRTYGMEGEGVRYGHFLFEGLPVDMITFGKAPA